MKQHLTREQWGEIDGPDKAYFFRTIDSNWSTCFLCFPAEVVEGADDWKYPNTEQMIEFLEGGEGKSCKALWELCKKKLELS